MASSNEKLTNFPFYLRIFALGKRYFVSTPWWLKKFYSSYTWDIKTIQKTIYLTFDDGPHPIATPFVLDQLKKYNARASFFCLGNNVKIYPEIYHRIIQEGHTVGNHSHTHPNGWRTPDETYLEDIATAKRHISSALFRPPYGRITRRQAQKLGSILGIRTKIIMWSVLSGDFDLEISKQKCLDNVMRHGKPGSIVVFHDSEKAFPRLAYSLPLVLKNFEEKGYKFSALEQDS
jgi:peptidoglycan/xylan/chitin deacetylase (PgdA/CDA1 family)